MSPWLNGLVRTPAILLSITLLLAACASSSRPLEPAVPNTNAWRNVATGLDRERLRDWRKAWVGALAKAQAAGHGPEIEAEGELLQPDSALADASLPAGDYRCRTIKIGAQSQGLLDYVAYPAFDCRVGTDGETSTFFKLTGSQRPIGRLFPDSDRRRIFLGTLQLGDEQGKFRYGHDRDRDMAGILERIDERRWRLVFPYPHFESVIDVMELVPSR